MAKERKVGYDLDGTICEKSEINKKYMYCSGEERKQYKLIREYHMKTAKLVLKPKEEEYYIITSRKPENRSVTMQWLLRANLKPLKVYFMDSPRKRTNMIKYKADLINKLNLVKYYEDDEKIAKSLKRKCPFTQIKLIKPSISKYVLKS